MAITFSESAGKAVSASSINLEYNCTAATNGLLAVGIDVNLSTTGITTVAYGGVNLTYVQNFLNGVSKPQKQALFYLVSPAQGTNSLSVTISTSDTVAVAAASFQGVKQVSGLSATSQAQDSSTPFTTSLTTVTSNELIFLSSGDDDSSSNARTPQSGTTELVDLLTPSALIGFFAGYQIATTPNAYSMGYADSAVTDSTHMAMSFQDASGGTVPNLTLPLMGIG